jgi:hypothetical protein
MTLSLAQVFCGLLARPALARWGEIPALTAIPAIACRLPNRGPESTAARSKTWVRGIMLFPQAGLSLMVFPPQES